MIFVALILILIQNGVVGWMLYKGLKVGELTDVDAFFLGMMNAAASLLWPPPWQLFSVYNRKKKCKHLKLLSKQMVE